MKLKLWDVTDPNTDMYLNLCETLTTFQYMNKRLFALFHIILFITLETRVMYLS